MFNIGPTELLVILVLALLIFGPSRLPEIGRTVGKSLREVRKATQDIRDQFETDIDDEWNEPPRITPKATSAAPDKAAGNGKAEEEQQEPGAVAGQDPSS